MRLNNVLNRERRWRTKENQVVFLGECLDIPVADVTNWRTERDKCVVVGLSETWMVGPPIQASFDAWIPLLTYFRTLGLPQITGHLSLRDYAMLLRLYVGCPSEL